MTLFEHIPMVERAKIKKLLNITKFKQ